MCYQASPGIGPKSLDVSCNQQDDLSRLLLTAVTGVHATSSPVKRSLNDFGNVLNIESSQPSYRQQSLHSAVTAMPGDYDLRVSRLVDGLSLTHADDLPIFGPLQPVLTDVQRIVKRTFDLLVTAILTPILLPIMGIIALAVRLESAGPVIVTERRAGEHGRLFNMFKFRTTMEQADESGAVVESVDGQGRILQMHSHIPRITRIGRLLRRWQLDELPQFLNVLKGEMTIVGPRPEHARRLELYQGWQRARFAVPQGITGWWQVNGSYDRLMHLHVDDDLFYVKHRSVWLDMYILTRTPVAVARGRRRARNKYNKLATRVIKRTMDIVLSSLLLILLSPMFLDLALKIRQSGGSAFYVNERIGYGKRKFKCYKFRTMWPDSDDLLWALLENDPVARDEWEKYRKVRREDPRVTPIGRFLRLTSLDELPQLWNILIGEMSLVGPRPILEREIDDYGRQLDDYGRSVPGLTGLWQVSGRNELGFDERVALDMMYLRNWSFWLDIMILAKTAGVVFGRKGAY